MLVLWFTDVQPSAVRRHLGLPPNPGPQAWVDRLAEELAGRPEIDLHIASPGNTPYAAFTVDGITYHDVAAAPRSPSRIGRIVEGWRRRVTDREALAAAERLAEELQPEIVHVHGTESAFGLVSTSLASCPCVVSLQGLLTQYQHFYFSGRTAGEIGRMAIDTEFVKGRGLIHGYLRMRAMALREIEVMQRGRWFIGRTDWDRASLAAVNPVAKYFHCDEIMRREFYAARWAPKGAGTRIYSTSSSMLFKGGETLIAAAGILRRGGVRDLSLRIAGLPAGSEVHRLYRRAAERAGVTGSIEWLDRLDAGAIVEELARADVFAYPTHIDNSPNALVEAMLAGPPVVASYTGGIPSMVRDGVDGLLVPRGDPPALAAAIRRLSQDRPLGSQLAKAARTRALERNDPGRIVERTVDIYREVISSAGPRAR